MKWLLVNYWSKLGSRANSASDPFSATQLLASEGRNGFSIWEEHSLQRGLLLATLFCFIIKKASQWKKHLNDWPISRCLLYFAAITFEMNICQEDLCRLESVAMLIVGPFFIVNSRLAEVWIHQGLGPCGCCRRSSLSQIMHEYQSSHTLCSMWVLLVLSLESWLTGWASRRFEQCIDQLLVLMALENLWCDPKIILNFGFLACEIEFKNL